MPPPLLLLTTALSASAAAVSGSQSPSPPTNVTIADDPGEQIPGPKDPSDAASVAAWRTAMVEWRSRMRNKIQFNGSVFEVPELKWTQTSYIQPQMHPYDRFFYDPLADNYTVQKFLDDVDARYGGVDSILMWPTYTNIGTDARSQFDLINAMPGGLPGVRAVVDELHKAGVKVLLPYNPWDGGTRRGKVGGPYDPAPPPPPGPPGPPPAPLSSCYRRTNIVLPKCAKDTGWDTYTEDTPGSGQWTRHPNTNCYTRHGGTVIQPEPFSKALSLANCQKACQSQANCTAVTVAQTDGNVPTDDIMLNGLLKAVDADGFNGDTMKKVPAQFYTTSVRLNHPVAIEPEGGGAASDGNGNWETMGWGYWKYPLIPSVDAWKWFDSRRLTNVCERWSKDHTNALQYALFNGDGFESWENVWGTWNGITQRDGEQIRRVGAILRFLGGRGYLQSQDWVPHSPTAAPHTLFASEWPLGAAGTAWTVVNRDTASPHEGPAINISSTTANGALNFYDLWFGKKISPTSGGQIPLSLEAKGYGAVLATPNSTQEDAELAAFLTKMQAMQASGGPIQKLDGNWTYELQTRVPIAPAVVGSTPQGMVEIPGGAYRFVVRGIEIEGAGRSIKDNPFGVDFQYPWESVPNRFHDHNLSKSSAHQHPRHHYAVC